MKAFVGFFIFFIAASSLGIGDGRNIKNLIRFETTQNGQTTFNVVDFGAIGDGKTDNSQAFLKAWKALCGEATVAQPILHIPKGKTFLLQPVDFVGPCKSSTVQVEVLGNIVAPSTVEAWKDYDNHWLGFSHVASLNVYGSGQIDGQGSAWWTNHGDNRPKKALHFLKCDNLQLSGLTHINSPKAHIGIVGCKGVSISHLHIIAPDESPNTDGIDISQSSNVEIHNSVIGTGDDCVAINDGCSKINITNVVCGPGHGISVGSLGKDGAHETVEDVSVSNILFKGTQNGARIKTYQGGSGFARRISFEEIELRECRNPIIIDQYYCNGEHNCKNQSSAVQVSNVIYKNFRGTSATKQAITFDCAAIGCTNVVMNEVQITSSNSGEKTEASCQNVRGTCHSIAPQVPCLSASV